ncbi:MAG TPA: hypothetical protein VE621_08015 [Bryobacteraceae bacterium]|nr:hypothetical protein [Bryobacteraceae bacterium]
MHTADSLERAGCWFLRSGIQEPSGGVARYYYTDIRKNARISTEITGYAVSTLVFLFKRIGERGFLEAARKGADFLVDTAWDRKAQTFPFEYSANGDVPQNLTYFFDCGIIVRGLLAVWRVTSDDRYLDAALAGAEAMKRDFAVDDTFHPILRLPEKSPIPYTSQWSRQPGCYQLKSAMAWFDLAEVTGEDCFRRAYERALVTAIGQEPSFLPTVTPEKTMDRLHAYAYFLEALLPVADRPEIRQVLEAGMKKAGTLLREIAPIFERSDVSAQLLRVRLLAHHAGAVPLDYAAAEDEASRIRTFQCRVGEERLAGGYYFGRKPSGLMPFVNPVSTAFCLQALAWWEDYLAGNFKLESSALI